MTATGEEQTWAQTNNVRIRHWAAPTRLVSAPSQTVTGVEFVRTSIDGAGRLTLTDETFVLAADMVLKAIGQSFIADPVDGGPTVQEGRIMVDADRRTSLDRVYAGGDCVPGADLTVAAVQDGKLAAAGIHRQLSR
jgi:dihydropyrimidine dehydrogenase (NAD+) subunit PreT